MVHVDVYRSWEFGYRKYGAKRDTHPERHACWWTNGREFRTVRKSDIREIILNGSPSIPWAMWVTTSYKKHGSIRTPVNHRSRGAVGFDERIVDASNEGQVIEWWERLNTALRDGIFRGVIETLDCRPLLISKIGLSRWLDFERWAKPIHKSTLYALLCYLLPSQEWLHSGWMDDGENSSSRKNDL